MLEDVGKSQDTIFTRENVSERLNCRARWWDIVDAFEMCVIVLFIRFGMEMFDSGGFAEGEVGGGDVGHVVVVEC